MTQSLVVPVPEPYTLVSSNFLFLFLFLFLLSLVKFRARTPWAQVDVSGVSSGAPGRGRFTHLRIVLGSDAPLIYGVVGRQPRGLCASPSSCEFNGKAQGTKAGAGVSPGAASCTSPVVLSWESDIGDCCENEGIGA